MKVKESHKKGLTFFEDPRGTRTQSDPSIVHIASKWQTLTPILVTFWSLFGPFLVYFLARVDMSTQDLKIDFSICHELSILSSPNYYLEICYCMAW